MEWGLVSAEPAVKHVAPLDVNSKTFDAPNETSINSFAWGVALRTASATGCLTEKCRPAGRITFGGLSGCKKSGAADAGAQVQAFNTKIAAGIKAGRDL
jgi:hypothetical protein